MNLPFQRMSPVRLRWFDSYCHSLPAKTVEGIRDMVLGSIVTACGPDGVRWGRDDPAMLDRWWRMRAGLKGDWVDAVLACPALLPSEEAALGFRRNKKVDTCVTARWSRQVLRGALFCIGYSEKGQGRVLPFTLRRLAGGIQLMARERDPYGMVPMDREGIPVVRVFFQRVEPEEIIVGGSSHLVPREMYRYHYENEPNEMGVIIHPPME